MWKEKRLASPGVLLETEIYILKKTNKRSYFEMHNTSFFIKLKIKFVFHFIRHPVSSSSKTLLLCRSRTTWRGASAARSSPVWACPGAMCPEPGSCWSAWTGRCPTARPAGVLQHWSSPPDRYGTSPSSSILIQRSEGVCWRRRSQSLFLFWWRGFLFVVRDSFRGDYSESFQSYHSDSESHTVAVNSPGD